MAMLGLILVGTLLLLDNTSMSSCEGYSARIIDFAHPDLRRSGLVNLEPPSHHGFNGVHMRLEPA